jgi:hypothetical protein
MRNKILCHRYISIKSLNELFLETGVGYIYYLYKALLYLIANLIGSSIDTRYTLLIITLVADAVTAPGAANNPAIA